MKGEYSLIIILSYDFKNVLYIGSACIENLIAGHPIVGLLEDPLGAHDMDIDLIFCTHCQLWPIRSL